MQSPADASAARRQLVLRFWHSASGFWRGRSAALAWPLALVAMLAAVLQLVVQYRLNIWSRDLFNAIEQRNVDALTAQALTFAPLAAASLLLAITAAWSRMTADREWRDWLSRHLFDYWAKNDGYARLKHVPGDNQTPEYRIADDARIATDLPLDLALGFLSSVLTAATFIGVLWSVGGSLPVNAAGLEVTIGGYLVLAVIVYSIVLTSATLFVARRLMPVLDANKAAEAELRAAGAALRAASEGMAATVTGIGGRRAATEALANVKQAWRALCYQVLRMTAVSHTNLLIAPSVSLLLCAPKYLSGQMTLGVMVQAAAAFVAVQGAFNWIADNYSRLAEWTTSASRVGALLCSLDQLHGEAVKSFAAVPESEPAGQSVAAPVATPAR